MTVLVVEDESRMAELLRQALTEEGYGVTLAGTGLSAVRFARSTPFDLLILDGMLPELDGHEVARRLRADGNRTPTLMLTARDSASDLVAGIAAGADDYMTKPFSLQTLLDRVTTLISRATR